MSNELAFHDGIHIVENFLENIAGCVPIDGVVESIRLREKERERERKREREREEERESIRHVHAHACAPTHLYTHARTHIWMNYEVHDLRFSVGGKGKQEGDVDLGSPL